MNENITKQNQPSVSFAIPTYNSGAKLERLLNSIAEQEYSGYIEILVADGGSSDNTLDIAKKHCCKILKNERKLPEPGKAVCIDNATGELIVFVDDDNWLLSKNWLNSIVKPFIEDKEIVAAEPIKYEWDKNLTMLERYWALTGVNDPLLYYMGAYDKLNLVSNKWTGLKLKQEDCGDYIKVHLKKDYMPTIGANGFTVRADIIKKTDYYNLLDIDKMAEIINMGYNKIAKVKIGIFHTFVPDLKNYPKKAKRKAKNFFGNVSYPGVNANETTKRHYRYPNLKNGVLKFALSTIFVLPLILYSLKGYMKKKDIAWFMHIPVCWITFVVYGLSVAIASFSRGNKS